MTRDGSTWTCCALKRCKLKFEWSFQVNCSHNLVFLSNIIDGSYCTWYFIKTFIHFIMSFLRVDMSSFCQAFLSVCEVCLDLWQAYERMTVKIKDIKAWSKMLSPYLPTLLLHTYPNILLSTATRLKIIRYKHLRWFSFYHYHFQSTKIILRPSDAWLMRRSTQRPSVLYWTLVDFSSFLVDGQLGNPYLWLKFSLA